MGVLDDAIREHIELKRRNGADPTEVERLEKEAFGPISREGLAPPAAPGGPSADQEADEPVTRFYRDDADDEDGPTEDELLAEEQPPTTGAPHMGLGLGSDYPANPYAPPPVERDEPGVPADDPAEAPRDPQDAGPGSFDGPAGRGSSGAGAVSARDWGEQDWDAPPAREGDQPTQSYSLDDLEALRREEEAAAGGRAPKADRDVVPADPEAHDELEGTPDFLEETPEHDRLWFEQKPPKDFDF